MRSLARLAALLLLAGTGACSSPESRFYTLQPVPGAVQAGAPHAIEVRRIGLAGYLDRPDIVQHAEAYVLHVDSLQRWGEPLGDMIGSVLAQDLGQRLPSSQVFTQQGAIGGAADAVVELDVQRFDRDPDGQVVLIATLAIRRPDGHTAETLHLVAPAGPGDSGQAAGMSAVLAQAADRITKGLLF